jgi:hypothetical protein
MRITTKRFSSVTTAEKRPHWMIGSPVALLLALAFCVFPARAQQPGEPKAMDQPSGQPQPQSPNHTTSPNATTRVSQTNDNSVSEKPRSKGFSSPQAAAEALCTAARKNDSTDMLVILGPDAREILEGLSEHEGATEDRELFVQKYDQMHRLVREPDNTIALYVGAENWPLPVPLVRYNGAWYFDPALGKQEILYRQLGRNEMEAIRVSHALIDAEQDYLAGAHRYTNKFVSSDNQRDGLYWPSVDDANRSPIGPYLAHAGVTDSIDGRQPFHGYFYRILLQQPVAPDGDSKNSASPNANSFVILAFPARYRLSGVVTFLVDQNGDTYEKDLGPTSVSQSIAITSAHPDNTWDKVE